MVFWTDETAKGKREIKTERKEFRGERVGVEGFNP